MNRPSDALVVRKEGICWYTTLDGNKYKVPDLGWNDLHGSTAVLAGDGVREVLIGPCPCPLLNK